MGVNIIPISKNVSLDGFMLSNDKAERLPNTFYHILFKITQNSSDVIKQKRTYVHLDGAI